MTIRSPLKGRSMSVNNKQRVIGITREYLTELVNTHSVEERRELVKEVLNDPLQKNVGIATEHQPNVK